MRGPILNYRLGKMTHWEYEARASRVWTRDLEDEGEGSLAERIRRLFQRSTAGLDRAWCTATVAGPSLAGCEAAS